MAPTNNLNRVCSRLLRVTDSVRAQGRHRKAPTSPRGADQ
jgi:hypothetical protein